MNGSNLLTLFASMPISSRISLAGIGGGLLGYFVYNFFGTTGLMILLLGSLVVGGILLLYAFILKRIEKRKAAGFTEEMKGQSSATPQGISKAEQIAKLDDLRKKFESGVDKFKQAGKDVYALPWYMLVGEPGSGKTEAIRHSGIGFPPGLQDELQGVGGTINMNWWFSNNAIILDLAGRLVFSDVEAGGGSEWQTFLKLLKTQRTNCPINGMLLVIPADSLVKDSPETIHKKAYKIAQQLNLVQRTLDIRFPVFVVVTKSDLITGFREFFDNLHTPEAQQQILGWSNSTSIDEPFKPEMTEQYLTTVQERLLRRRLQILRDPTPSHDLSDSRFDEVDALFDFPASFARISGPLKQYLQLIFVPSEWSSKPLFLRGIYFTSSMQEGAALDDELAKVLGLSLDKLPEGRIWERERSFFLRDVFLSKIFVERGLVTRATNVQKAHMQRRIALLGTSAVGILLLFILTWFGGRSLDRTIGRERRLWMYAADELKEGRSIAVVAPRKGDATAFEYRGAQTIRLEDGQRSSLGEMHQVLQRAVRKPIEIPLIFRLSRPFDHSLNAQRKQAERVLFDVSVLRPGVTCTRDKMEGATGWTPEATAALGELIRIEADAARLDYEPRNRLDARVNLDAFFRYLLDPAQDYPAYAAGDRPAYEQSLEWCYDPKGGGGVWPPPWLPRGIVPSANRPIDLGVDRFIEHCTRSANLLEQQLAKIRALWPDLEAFRREMERPYRESEEALLKLLEANMDKLVSLRGFEAIERDWQLRHDQLAKDLEALRARFAELKKRYEEIPLCQASDVAAAYQLAIATSLKEVQQALDALPVPIGGGAGGSTNRVQAASGLTLVPDIAQRKQKALDRLQEDMKRRMEKDLEEFTRLYAGRRKQVDEFETRFVLYDPVAIPDKLKIRTQPWRTYQEQFRGMDVTDVHRSLEKVCKRIEQVFTAYGQVMTNVPRQRVEALVNRSRLGVDKIYSEAFFRDASEVVKVWSAMKGLAGEDRDTLLALTLDAFKREYVVNCLETQEDYVAQYWQDLIYFGLVSMADEIQPEIDRILKELTQYARFPLDLPGKNESDLTLNEVLHARELLEKLGTIRTAGETNTLGAGAMCGISRVDAQLDRLRNLQLGDTVAWVNAAAAVVKGLPDRAERPLICRVSIVPMRDQVRLLQSTGRDPNDRVGAIWRHMSVGQLPLAANLTRASTEQGDYKEVASLKYPGSTITFQFFRFWSDAREAQVPSGTDIHKGDWAVLRLLHEAHGKPVDPSDLRKWAVVIAPYDKDAERDRFLWLQLEFEKPLPSIEQWPRRPSQFKKP